MIFFSNISNKVSIFALILTETSFLLAEKMTKYNINEKKKQIAEYGTKFNPAILDELQSKMLNLLLVQKKFLDKDYSAKQLARDLGTNSRYVSAVLNLKMHTNYASLVNSYRIEEAMSILIDKRYLKLNMEQIADMVGFANRQSFYAAFYKIKKCTPRDYKMTFLKDMKII